MGHLLGRRDRGTRGISVDDVSWQGKLIGAANADMANACPVMQPRPTEAFLVHTQVPEWPGYHVLGCFEKRVTVYSQQIRALNLVWALHKERLIVPNNHIAVVGGGVAGVTAAAAAKKLGYKVTLFEHRQSVMQLQHAAAHRYLHPRIYDWPEQWSDNNSADLPLLNWHAGTAQDVIKVLRAEWNTCSHGISQELDTIIIKMDKTRTLKWKRKDATDPLSAQFDCIIVAAGFGVEKFDFDFKSKSYWDDDELGDLPSVPSADGVRRRYLISGSGDGALVDVLRARVLEFQLDTVVAAMEHINEAAGLASLKQKLLDIEEEARRLRRRDLNDVEASRYLFNEYAKLTVPAEIDELFKENTASTARIKLRTDTTAMFCYKHEHPYWLGSSILNRFLVSRLLHGRDSNVVPRAATSVDKDTLKKISDNRYQLTIGSDVEEFYGVSIRHGAAKEGPGSPFEKDPLRQIKIACESTLKVLSELDQTRDPIWDEGAFGAELPSLRRTTASAAGGVGIPPSSEPIRSTQPSPAPSAPTGKSTARRLTDALKVRGRIVGAVVGAIVISAMAFLVLATRSVPIAIPNVRIVQEGTPYFNPARENKVDLLLTTMRAAPFTLEPKIDGPPSLGEARLEWEKPKVECVKIDNVTSTKLAMIDATKCLKEFDLVVRVTVLRPSVWGDRVEDLGRMKIRFLNEVAP